MTNKLPHLPYYLVFDNHSERAATKLFVGASDDFYEACEFAFEHKDAEIALFLNFHLVRIVSVSDGYKWLFESDSPYHPCKFNKGEGVHYHYGSKKRVGEIEYGLVEFKLNDKHDYPRRDMTAHAIEVEYVINGEWEDESDIIEVISEDEVAE